MTTQSLTAKDVNGGFAVIGSLCFPAKAGDTVVIKAKANADASADQLLLFYDDQAGSFDAFGSSAGTCQDKINLARPVCQNGGVNCEPGWKLKPGKEQTYTVTINEETRRQWFFVVSNCVDDESIKSPEEFPVQLDSISISSSKGIPCSQLKDGGDAVSIGIGISFLVVLVLVFMATSAIYYRKSRGLPSFGASRRGGGLLGNSGSAASYSGRSQNTDNDLSAPKTGHDDL